MGMIYNPTFKPGDNLPADVVNNIIESIKEDEGTLSTLSGEITRKVNVDEIYSNSQIDEKLNKKANLENSEGGFEGGNGTHTTTGGAIGNKAFSQSGGAVGKNAMANSGGGAVGENAFTYNGFAGGYNAKTGDGIQNAIQIGEGVNQNEKTLQIYDYQLMDANGHIPNDRMPTKANVDSVYTKEESNTKLEDKVDKILSRGVGSIETSNDNMYKIVFSRNVPKEATDDGSGIDERSINVYSAETTKNVFYSKEESKNLFASKSEIIVEDESNPTSELICHVDSGNNCIYIHKTAVTNIQVIITPPTTTGYEIFYGHITNYSFQTSMTNPTCSITDPDKKLIWLGTDCELKNNEYVFIPQAGKCYDMLFYYNGNNFVGLVTGYSI